MYSIYEFLLSIDIQRDNKHDYITINIGLIIGFKIIYHYLKIAILYFGKNMLYNFKAILKPSCQNSQK